MRKIGHLIGLLVKKDIKEENLPNFINYRSFFINQRKRLYVFLQRMNNIHIFGKR